MDIKFVDLIDHLVKKGVSPHEGLASLVFETARLATCMGIPKEHVVLAIGMAYDEYLRVKEETCH